MMLSKCLSVALVPSQGHSLVCCDDCVENMKDLELNSGCRRSGVWTKGEGYLCYCDSYKATAWTEHEGWVS